MKFDCRKCANVGTEACVKCNAIESPSGKVRKPSKFIECDTKTIVINAMLDCINRGSAIPINIVMIYNKEVDEG